jgi:peptidoglycan/LPS O-acetylase OafA/YrhL
MLDFVAGSCGTEAYVVAISESRQGRHWADVLAILTGLVLMALAIWPGEPQANADAAREAGNPQLQWLAYVVAGGSAIAAVLIAQRWNRRPLARGLLALGGLTLLAVLLVFQDFGPRALLTMLLQAIALLTSAVAIGPMPREA